MCIFYIWLQFHLFAIIILLLIVELYMCFLKVNLIKLEINARIYLLAIKYLYIHKWSVQKLIFFHLNWFLWMKKKKKRWLAKIVNINILFTIIKLQLNLSMLYSLYNGLTLLHKYNGVSGKWSKTTWHNA